MSTIDAPLVYAFQTPQGGWRVTGSARFARFGGMGLSGGTSPEEIVAQFPSLSPEQVYGAIAFYLHRQREIDEYLKDQEEEWEKLPPNRRHDWLP